ncbi:hypothetical protein T492DRAFT_968649 [Pavlovales sp. CCMP2436]|nr:hypothetical protein T492DRAFT_968649 [Pavlovales sp. CCMP2436]
MRALADGDALPLPPLPRAPAALSSAAPVGCVWVITRGSLRASARQSAGESIVLSPGETAFERGMLVDSASELGAAARALGVAVVLAVRADAQALGAHAEVCRALFPRPPTPQPDDTERYVTHTSADAGAVTREGVERAVGGLLANAKMGFFFI